MKYIMLLLLLTVCLSCSAQQITQVDKASAAFYYKAMPVIKPAYKALVETSALSLKRRTINSDSLLEAFRNNRTLAGLQEMDLQALVQLVMIRSANDQENELRTRITGMKKVNQQKKDVRQKKDSLKARPHRTGSTGDSLQTQADRMQDSRDAISEVDEEESLRLRLLMDHRQKMLEMISNLMKKLSDTQDGLIKNLK